MKSMEGETEAGLGIGVLRQERDINDEECGTERAGCQYQERGDADTKREGMPMVRSVILKEQG
jgi:hypothetical protein